jgi:hypothetical protein
MRKAIRNSICVWRLFSAQLSANWHLYEMSWSESEQRVVSNIFPLWRYVQRCSTPTWIAASGRFDHPYATASPYRILPLVSIAGN